MWKVRVIRKHFNKTKGKNPHPQKCIENLCCGQHILCLGEGSAYDTIAPAEAARAGRLPALKKKTTYIVHSKNSNVEYSESAWARLFSYNFNVCLILILKWRITKCSYYFSLLW